MYKPPVILGIAACFFAVLASLSLSLAVISSVLFSGGRLDALMAKVAVGFVVLFASSLSAYAVVTWL